MAGSIFVRPKAVPINAGGVPYSGAKYTFYLTGTSTLASVYTDSALTTPHANPVVADANGVFAPIWLDPSKTYRARLTTSSDVLIEDVDPVSSGFTAAQVGAALYPRSAAESGAGKAASTATPYVAELLQQGQGPILAASDYVRAVPESIRAYLPEGRTFVTLGTDGFGRSDTRAALREFFGVDAASIARAARRRCARYGT